MPRPRIRANNTAHLRELDAAIREVERAEKRLEHATERMMAALFAALDDEETNLSVTEAARRMGYSREQISRIVSHRQRTADAVEAQSEEPDTDPPARPTSESAEPVMRRKTCPGVGPIPKRADKPNRT